MQQAQTDCTVHQWPGIDMFEKPLVLFDVSSYYRRHPMNNISVKVSPELQQRLARVARQNRLSQSELIRRALTHFLDERAGLGDKKSAADLAGDLAGCVHGGPIDLSSDPKHLEGFGQP